MTITSDPAVINESRILSNESRLNEGRELMDQCGEKNYIPKSESFSMHFIDAMRDFGQSPFTASRLHDRILDERFDTKGESIPVHVSGEAFCFTSEARIASYKNSQTPLE